MKAVSSLLAIFMLACSAFGQSIGNGIVTADKANLRGTPAVMGKVVDTLKKDTPLEIFAEKGDWYLVQGPDNTGWISSRDMGGTEKFSHGITTQTIEELPKGVTIDLRPDRPWARPLDTRKYYKGPKGGCYYLNSSGKKTYVDHSFCN
jgi:hypothetical protein